MSFYMGVTSFVWAFPSNIYRTGSVGVSIPRSIHSLRKPLNLLEWVGVGCRLTLKDARQQQWRREFLNLGEILKAYDYLATTGVVPIVKLDEFEKLPQVCQAFFYQLFTDGHASVPRLTENNGHIGVGVSS